MISLELNTSSMNRLTRALTVLFMIPGILLTPKVGMCAPTIQDTSELTTQKKYDEISGKWREAAKSAAVAAGKFYVAEREEAAAIQKQWRKALDDGNRQLELLKPVAIQLLQESVEPDNDLVQFIIRLMEQDLANGLYEQAFELNELLLSKNLTDGKSLERIMTSRATLAIYTNRFEIAKDLEDNHRYVIENMPLRAKSLYLSYLDKLAEAYEIEAEIQKKEAEIDDLPRVELKTTKGTIVIELFENHAPNTVGNFISLVDRKAYDGMVFHRVINEFMAQTGGFNAQGHRAIIGYTIYDECNDPNTRLHFRGSVSMAKTSEPDSGSSQFFINLVPTPGLNFKHTVFGRVISGWDALDRLNRTHTVPEDGTEEPIPTAVPDQIISARVLRKRDHEYEPDKVK